MLKKKLGQRGFTLIELLVVIAIIGILSSVVLVSLNSARVKARDAKRIADIASIQTALALYFDSYSQYPADLATLSTVSERFLSAPPVGPNNEAYSYTPSSGDTPGYLNYHLGILLEQDASVLDSDRDCNSTASSPTVGACFTVGVALTATPPGFDGTAALVYDVTP